MLEKEWTSGKILVKEEVEEIKDGWKVRNHILFEDEEDEKERDERIIEMGMVDMEKKDDEEGEVEEKLETELRREMDEAQENSVARELRETEWAMKVMRARVKLFPTKEWMDGHKEKMREASVILAKNKIDSSALTDIQIDSWAKDEMWHVDTMKSIFREPSKWVVVDCGGNGDCGPLSMIGALIGAEKKKVPTLSNIRKLVDNETERSKEDVGDTIWWTDRHFGVAAAMMECNIICMQERPRSWASSVERLSGGNSSKPIVVIGGGASKHWCAVMRIEDEKRTRSRANRVLEKTSVIGSLTEFWRSKGVDARTLPMRKVGLGINTTEDPIVISSQETMDESK